MTVPLPPFFPFGVRTPLPEPMVATSMAPKLYEEATGISVPSAQSAFVLKVSVVITPFLTVSVALGGDTTRDTVLAHVVAPPPPAVPA